MTDEPDSQPVGLPAVPASPATVAAYLDSLKDEELLPAIDSIVAQHEVLGAANPCCTSIVGAVLSRKKCDVFPNSWNFQDRLVFSQMNLAMREIVLRRENERDAALRTAQNRISNELKRLRGGATTPPWAKQGSENVYSQAK
jgi:hypothetical protein